MRALLLLLLLATAACEAPSPETLRLVTLEHPHSSGLSLRELPAPVLESIGLAYGLAVVQADAAAERAGLRIGDVVYGVNRTPIRNLEEFSRLMSRQAEGSIGLLVRRGKSDLYVAIELGAPRAPEGPPRPPRGTLLRT
ncbi:MAG: PDZ domain-containing protein [Betaproteobacteria bacterium]|nr:PDZ domain-containing protein [Betaproteobacteria bacterium]